MECGQGSAKKGTSSVEWGQGLVKWGLCSVNKGANSVKWGVCCKPLAIAFVSTFTISPVLAHNPIVKELTKPALFCLAGKLVIPLKKLKQF